jgi:hypothetical protein
VGGEQVVQAAPQWSGESFVTHALSHWCVLLGHLHAPLTQLPPLGQSVALQQALLAMQAPLQLFMPSLQVQLCATHDVPVAHSPLPQHPLSGMHSPAHSRCVAGQEADGPPASPLEPPSPASDIGDAPEVPAVPEPPCAEAPAYAPPELVLTPLAPPSASPPLPACALVNSRCGPLHCTSNGKEHRTNPNIRDFGTNHTTADLQKRTLDPTRPESSMGRGPEQGSNRECPARLGRSRASHSIN